MKNTAPIGLLALAVVAVVAGCATMGRRPGYLVYYDVEDGGATWCWENHYGWRYLGEREFWWSRTHGPQPSHRRDNDDHKKGPPGDDDHKKHPPGDDDHHHHPPGQPPPGDAHQRPGDGHRQPPHPGEKPPWHGQYLFFAADGAVLRSRDGTTFSPVGQMGEHGEIVRHDSPTEYRGRFDATADSFNVATHADHPASGWVGSLFGSSAGGDGGGGRYSGSAAGFGSTERGSYSSSSSGSSGGSYSGAHDYSGGSSFSSGSSGFSADQGSSSVSSMSSGSGGFSGGGGGFSGGGGTISGDSTVDHRVSKEQ